jgi:ubiquinone/menaquinone biosynthesis C-methylase UbiE
MSQDALQKISSSISKTKNNVKLILGNMDNLDSLVNSEKFDLVSSCFALYYSKDLPLLIQKIKKVLVPGGRLFVCGPIEGNNIELIKFHSQIPHAKKQNLPFIMSEKILPELKNQFKTISKDIFVNPLSFPSSNSLIDYWKAYALYESHIEEEFIKKVKLHFSKNNVFVTTKKILGVTVSI